MSKSNNFIELKIANNNINNKDKFIKETNSFFNNRDLYLEKKDDDILLFLNSIDMDELNEFVKNDPNKKVLKETINEHKSYGVKSGKKIFVDYNKERKVKNRKKKEAKRGKYFYAKDHDFSKNNNELSEEYKNSIVAADSEEYLKQLPDNCIDIIFTSPPYNFGLDYDANADDIEWDKYLDKLFRVFKECIRVLKYGGRFAVNVQPLFSDYIPLHHIIGKFFIEQKLIWKTEILWEKNNYNCKYTAWGSWKSPSSPYLKYTWEFVEVYMKGTLKKKGNKENIDITGDEFKDWVYAKWSIAPERNMKEYDHPAMFPEELARRVLKLFSYQDDIVLDPFGGVGTTAAVAKENNRNYISIDLSQEYTDKAKKRVANKVDQMSITEIN